MRQPLPPKGNSQIYPLSAGRWCRAQTFWTTMWSVRSHILHNGSLKAQTSLWFLLQSLLEPPSKGLPPRFPFCWDSQRQFCRWPPRTWLTARQFGEQSRFGVMKASSQGQLPLRDHPLWGQDILLHSLICQSSPPHQQCLLQAAPL